MLAEPARFFVHGFASRRLERDCTKQLLAVGERHGTDIGLAILFVQFRVRPRDLQWPVRRRGKDNRCLLVDGLVHCGLDRANQIGLFTERGAVRHAAHQGMLTTQEANTHTLTLEATRELGRNCRDGFLETGMIDTGCNRFEHRNQAIAGRGPVLPDERFEQRNAPLETGQHGGLVACLVTLYFESDATVYVVVDHDGYGDKSVDCRLIAHGGLAGAIDRFSFGNALLDGLG